MTLTSLLGKVSKRVWALTAIATATVAIPAGLLAWGPDRPTFTMAHPSDHVTFNSITDNPVQGDERNFVQIRNVTKNNNFSESESLVAGNEYEVYVFYHNDAASNLNDAAHNYKGIATGAYMKAELPASVAAGSTGTINGYVGASNSSPSQVWDEATIKNTTGGAMDIRIESGSAKITNNGKTNGKTLPDAIFSSGTPLGYDALDGKVPGCTQYSGYVTYRFKADQPNFTVAKTVSAHGANQYSENVNAKAGDLVDFKIEYKNTGTTVQNNVVIRDTLPAHLTYQAGTTYYADSTTNGQWKAVSADTVTKQGITVGNYTAGANAYVKFTAKVDAESNLVCGTNKFTNTAAADTANGSKSDTATVTVNKDCVEQVQACNLDTMKIETVDKTKIDNVHYTTDLSKCKPVEKVQACNLDTLKIETVDKSKIDNVHYTTDLTKCQPVEKVQACNLDTLKIETVDKSKIDNVHYTTDLTKCQPVEKVQACNLDTKKIETVDKSKIDNIHYTTDLSKCQVVEKVQACNLDTLKVEMVDKSKIDDVHYTTDLTKCAPKPETVVACNLETFKIETVEKSKIDDVHYSTDLTKCQEQVCRISDKTIVTINKADFDNSVYTTDMSQCEETPTTPPTTTELPHTGISDGIMSVIGAGSLVGVTGAYVASRRFNK